MLPEAQHPSRSAPGRSLSALLLLPLLISSLLASCRGTITGGPHDEDSSMGDPGGQEDRVVPFEDLLSGSDGLALLDRPPGDLLLRDHEVDSTPGDLLDGSWKDRFWLRDQGSPEPEDRQPPGEDPGMGSKEDRPGRIDRGMDLEIGEDGLLVDLAPQGEDLLLVDVHRPGDQGLLPREDRLMEDRMNWRDWPGNLDSGPFADLVVAGEDRPGEDLRDGPREGELSGEDLPVVVVRDGAGGDGDGEDRAPDLPGDLPMEDLLARDLGLDGGGGVDGPDQPDPFSDFVLEDRNPRSPWFGMYIGPRDLLGTVYLFYFVNAG